MEYQEVQVTNPHYDLNAPVNANSLYGGLGILGMVGVAIVIAFYRVIFP